MRNTEHTVCQMYVFVVNVYHFFGIFGVVLLRGINTYKNNKKISRNQMIRHSSCNIYEKLV
jgi:PII-like signaling protein